MSDSDGSHIHIHDFKPKQGDFHSDVLDGLRKSRKELPSKYFYDERGSHLFERICTLEEYYIPDTEMKIMETCIDEIVQLMGENIVLIEYGSGNSTKTRFLLDHLRNPSAYVPIDICHEQLVQAAKELASKYPDLEVLPVCADYTGEFELPACNRLAQQRIVYFPGSTIGNFTPEKAIHFLRHIAEICGPGGGLLIGVDLEKDPDILYKAYNDTRGVTAAFNLNLLERINRELNGNFQPEWFEHRALYNPDEGRVEMYLISLREQEIKVDDTTILFREGESIFTESSYKFSLDGFKQLAEAAGFEVRHVWTDRKQWFSVQYLVNVS